MNHKNDFILFIKNDIIEVYKNNFWKVFMSKVSVTNEGFFESIGNLREVPAEYLALCPLDGRYKKTGSKLSPYFSEYALVKNRVKVEVFWVIYLLKNTSIVKNLNLSKGPDLSKILAVYEKFSYKSFERIKEIESVTNHDVKAVELFVAEQLELAGMKELKSLVHIGCTSEDINNPSYANMIKLAIINVWLPAAEKLVSYIESLADGYAGVPMLAHTHGQPATPTTVGKEFAIFGYRMRKMLENLQNIKIFAKFNGATGNYSAISAVYPNEDWISHSQKFIEEDLGLNFNPMTTQIESHDYICELADCIRHFNNILIDLDLDMWMYISMEYFGQVAVKTEVGSSTMPHKVNPIRFENSEANVEMSNALLVALSNKLPRSRMQRDLSDSSTLRNVGLAFGYSLQAIEQTLGGLEKVTVNYDKISSELDSKWGVLAEPIQTMLRKYGIPDAYDQLKQLTRGKNITKEALHEFVNSLNMISEEDKQTLLSLTPASYNGYASTLAKRRK